MIVAAADWFFWKRFATLPIKHMVTAVEWYSPREAVAGAAGVALSPIPAAERTIASAALASALAYAQQRPTVALLVMHSGRIELEYYGTGYSAASYTDSQSMHKSVLALLLGQAIADGKIGSVNDPIGRYLPEWAHDRRGAIRIRDLLHMSSGLAQAAQSLNPFSSAMQLFLGTARRAKLMRTALAGTPDSVFDYNPINSELLGLIIESATGRRYAQYLSERLWQPLQAGTAYLWLDQPGGVPHTACCLQATARDWLRLGALIANRGYVGDREVVPARWLEEMQRSSDHNPNYGYQIWLGRSFTPARTYTPASNFKAFHSAPFLAPDVAYFDGSGGQRVYIVPSLQLVIVHTGEATRDWDDAFLPNTLIRGLTPPLQPGRSE